VNWYASFFTKPTKTFKRVSCTPPSVFNVLTLFPPFFRRFFCFICRFPSTAFLAVGLTCLFFQGGSRVHNSHVLFLLWLPNSSRFSLCFFLFYLQGLCVGLHPSSFLFFCPSNLVPVSELFCSDPPFPLYL